MALAVTAKRQPEEIVTEDDILELSAKAWGKIHHLKGDMRDWVLDWYKKKERSWAGQSAHDQKQTIWQIEELTGKMVQEASRLIALRGFDSIPVVLGKFEVTKEGMKATVTVPFDADDNNYRAMKDCLYFQVHLVPVAAAEFNGQSKPATPDATADPKLPFPEGAPAPEKIDPETGEILPNENVPANGAPPEDQLPPVDGKQ